MVKVAKPWGNYEILRVEEGFQIKRIEVTPGQRLSYQMHAKRCEKWTVAQGQGQVVLNDKTIAIQKGSMIDIPTQAKHRIENTGTESLIFFEVQIGEYLGEDDIVRLEDDYNRV